MISSLFRGLGNLSGVLFKILVKKLTDIEVVALGSLIVAARNLYIVVIRRLEALARRSVFRQIQEVILMLRIYYDKGILRVYPRA